MAARAAATQTQIQTDYQHVLHLKEEAKKQKDVIKLSCVNDKLVQLKAEMNIADSTNDQLQVSLSKSGDAQVLSQSLTQAGEAVRRLREEAAACVGEPELYKQEAGVTFTHPQFPDDPTQTPEGTYAGPPEAPGYASPFR